MKGNRGRPKQEVTSDQREYLAAIADTQQALAELNLFMDGLLAAARMSGLTWIAIGNAMGLCDNAVRMRMGRRERAA